MGFNSGFKGLNDKQSTRETAASGWLIQLKDRGLSSMLLGGIEENRQKFSVIIFGCPTEIMGGLSPNVTGFVCLCQRRNKL